MSIEFTPNFRVQAGITALILVHLTGTAACAQSQSRRGQPARSAPVGQGSATAGSSGTQAASGSRPTGPVALRGFCPVCLVEMKQWVRGNHQYQALYDGKVYLFPQQKQLDMFQTEPYKYVPALGGDCVVHYANTGQRIPGDLNFGIHHNERLFFLSSAQHKNEFLADPNRFADIDLALAGDCVVCRVEMQQKVPGRLELAVVHEGMRYLFPGAQQRDMFLAAPAKYVSAATATTGAVGSKTRVKSGTQPVPGR